MKNIGQKIWYKHGIMTAYLPPYRMELNDLYYKLKSNGKDYNEDDYNKYITSYREIVKKEEWNKTINEVIKIENNINYFKNKKRKCLKCNQIVIAGSNECKYVETSYDDTGYNPTETAYYVGDKRADSYRSMFSELFNLCLAEYSKGDTMCYRDGKICLNNDRE